MFGGKRCLSSLWRTEISDVGPAADHRLGWSVLDRVLFSLLGWAGAAEEAAAKDEEAGRAPADVERGAQLPPLGVGQDGVVEIPDDGVGRPADGDEDEHAGADEHDARCDGHLGFGRHVLHEVGALASRHPQDDPEGGHDDGHDHQGPGGLEVRLQGQQRVVDLALHLARALRHAVHPQALPDDLRRHNVGSDKGRDFPHRKGAHDDGPQEADYGQDEAQHLSSHRHHVEAVV